MLAAVAFAVIGAPIVPPFDASLKAHANLKSYSVQAVTSSKTLNRNRSLRCMVQVQSSGRLKLALMRNGVGYRWYTMDGSLFSGYDSGNDEYLTFRVTGKGTLMEKLVSVVPEADESLRAALDPSALAKLYAKLRDIRNWQVKNGSTYFYITPRSRFVLELDPRSKLMKRFELVSGQDRTKWNYKWAGCGTISKLNIPITAVKVASFRPAKPVAVYRSEAARMVARASVKAYGSLSNADMAISSGGSTSVSMRRGKAVVKSSSHEWRYDGRSILILYPSVRKAFVGKTTLLGIQEALAKADCRTDPYALQVVARKNPMRRLLIGGMVVKEVGSVSLEGEPCNVLEIANSDIRMTVAIRKSDRLIASESATYLQQANRIAPDSDRQIKYGKKDVSADAFSTKPPRGYKVIQLK